MHKYDSSQLTEFPRFETASAQSGVSTFFNKLWKLPLFSSSEPGDGAQKKDQSAAHNTPDVTKQSYEDVKPDTAAYAVEIEGRSLPNVLRRISSLIALGSGGGTRYADTELARYWMPDDISRECYECATRFSALRRRHHCRVCGQIFCNRCCSQRVPGQIFGCAGGLRVCTYCCNVVLSYLRENDLTGDMSPDLRTLQENLQVKFPDNKQDVHSRTKDNFMFSDEQAERNELRASPKEALQDVFRQLSFTLPTQQHRYRLVRYNGVWRGCDVLQWVMDCTNNKTRAQATLVCQNLLNEGYMESMIELPKFADYALYKPIVMPPVATQEDTAEECTRLVESVSSYCLDLNLDERSARLIKANKTENKSPSSEEESPVIQHTETTMENKNVCKAITECGEDHLKLLLRQCLSREGLQASWSTIIYPLCQQAAHMVSPAGHSDDIDVRNYVQIKKVVGDVGAEGEARSGRVLPGVALTKNVSHRGMPQRLHRPALLLLDCSVAYQRVEGRHTSLEPLLLQEQEYLMRCAARITALRPNVVLVKGTAARTVQDALRKDGVSLATGVGERALRRLARCTGADIVTSVDSRVAQPRLGRCELFYVQNYSNKTLMVFEGCEEQHLGCCIILRGPSLAEMKRVKRVVKFMLLACYNWRLEHAFLNDIEAILPEPGMNFEDDLDNINDGNDNENAEIKPDDTDDGDSKSDKVDATDKSNKIDGSSSSTNAGKDSQTGVNTDAVNVETSNDDPLQSARKSYSRKADSDKTLSCGVPIQDFSDPLRAKQNSIDDDVFLPKDEAKLKTDSDSERWSTEGALLSMSPSAVLPPPYLETEAGRRCPLRRYFHRPLFAPRPPPPPPPPAARRAPTNTPDPRRLHNEEMHPFIKNPITRSAEDPALAASLAHFRATGSLAAHAHKPNCHQYNSSIVKIKPVKQAETVEEAEPAPDPLSPEHHQCLSLLLYSYSNKSANVPDFCVNPWIVKMEMYGKHDISLGAFLDKYCFNNEYKCPSNNCQVPMNQHVRRFVHGDGCITITCNTIGHSTVDKLSQDQNNQVMFWSRCSRCGVGGGAVRVGDEARALSLAAYLRLARGGRYLRARRCPHPLRHHHHLFHAAHTTACFKFNKITTWDIELPPDVIATHYDTKAMREALLAQVNELMLKGHEIFNSVPELDVEKDHASFKQTMEQIHLALTSATLLEQTTPAGVVRWLWSVGDCAVLAEKLLRDAQDRLAPQARRALEDKSDFEDSSAGDTSSNDAAEVTLKADGDHTGTEDDEEKGDKKTVRQILSQLLSNNQPSNQSGMIIAGGVIPVVVFAGEIGSVIAATLASVQYQRQLHALMQPGQSEQEDPDNINGSKDKTDGDKAKVKSNEHIEVLLKDGLLCRVYYAAQFQRLRAMLLAPLASNPHIADQFSAPAAAPAPACAPAAAPAPVHAHSDDDYKEKDKNRWWCQTEEGFVRALSLCEPWAARGGKSGSTFCKTKDDRYVLKEMTKPEWQQFLEFAPHYFNYVINCHQNQLPTLLARIVGVYSVGGAGNGVLVMENLLYARPGLERRFDLKGASRHRLAPDVAPAAAVAAPALAQSPHVVLMDENLLHMRWQRALHVSTVAATVLWAAAERDTAFLAAHHVMDYSLLLGVADGQLVLGLIDYIRTFTWDKKLEHYVKKNLGSGQPTVVSPELYKRRFCAALRKYFLHCPDHWDGTHRGLRNGPPESAE